MLEIEEGELDVTLWKTHFGRGYGSLVRETMECMNECRSNTMLSVNEIRGVRWFWRGKCIGRKTVA